MLALGVIYIALYALQVISLPLSNPSIEDDTKVMKCIVEVISDTLSKPSPIPISQDCLETLRGDERIISILRHQNLLKELQELAAQGGATERVQKQKKTPGFEDELSEVLERQNMKPIGSEKSEEIPAVDHGISFNDKSVESTERKRQHEEGKTTSEQEPPENSQEDESAEELESNEVSKREEVSREEEIDNRITDEINKLEAPREKQEADDTSESQTSEEKEKASKTSQKDEEIPKEDESDESEKDNLKENTNETDNDDDDTQREDNSMKIPEDQVDDNEERILNAETSKEDDHLREKAIQEGGNSHHRQGKSEEDTSSKELEDSKRWNKMDELAKQLTSKKWVEENNEEESDRSMKIPPKHHSDELPSQNNDDRQLWQQSREDNSDSGTEISKRPEPEERKEEEGSANRKSEDQEFESLAAIEAELEKVAHKLHELRRG